MHRSTILGFTLAVGVLVPAGWHLLGASLEVDGKHLRPLEKSFVVDGVTVKLGIDRSVAMTGESVVATLVADGDAKDVTVDLRLLHTSNYDGARVAFPWESIDRETLTLHAAPGGGTPVHTKLVLGKRPRKLALHDDFQVLVTRHGAEMPTREFDGAGGKTADDFERMTDDGKGAGIGIDGWSGNSLAMSIKALDPITAHEPFRIEVTVKSGANHGLRELAWIDLTSEAALSGKLDDANDVQPALEITATKPDSYTADHGVIKQVFTVTPHAALPKTITFLASTTENQGPGPSGAGALEATTFEVTDVDPGHVAAK